MCPCPHRPCTNDLQECTLQHTENKPEQLKHKKSCRCGILEALWRGMCLWKLTDCRALQPVDT